MEIANDEFTSTIIHAIHHIKHGNISDAVRLHGVSTKQRRSAKEHAITDALAAHILIEENDTRAIKRAHSSISFEPTDYGWATYYLALVELGRIPEALAIPCAHMRGDMHDTQIIESTKIIAETLQIPNDDLEKAIAGTRNQQYETAPNRSVLFTFAAHHAGLVAPYTTAQRDMLEVAASDTMRDRISAHLILSRLEKMIREEAYTPRCRESSYKLAKGYSEIIPEDYDAALLRAEISAIRGHHALSSGLYEKMFREFKNISEDKKEHLAEESIRNSLRTKNSSKTKQLLSSEVMNALSLTKQMYFRATYLKLERMSVSQAHMGDQERIQWEGVAQPNAQISFAHRAEARRELFEHWSNKRDIIEVAKIVISHYEDPKIGNEKKAEHLSELLSKAKFGMYGMRDLRQALPFGEVRSALAVYPTA